MSLKYFEEKFGYWFIFGDRKDGTVDINDGSKDVFEGISRVLAEKLCKIHNKAIEDLHECVKSGTRNLNDVLPGEYFEYKGKTYLKTDNPNVPGVTVDGITLLHTTIPTTTVVTIVDEKEFYER